MSEEKYSSEEMIYRITHGCSEQLIFSVGDFREIANRIRKRAKEEERD